MQLFCHEISKKNLGNRRFSFCHYNLLFKTQTDWKVLWIKPFPLLYYFSPKLLRNKVKELCGNVVICFEIKFSAKKIHFSILQILQEAQHDTGFSLVKNPPCVRVNWAICASIVIVWENPTHSLLVSPFSQLIPVSFIVTCEKRQWLFVSFSFLQSLDCIFSSLQSFAN